MVENEPRLFDEVEKHIAEMMIDFSVEINNPLHISDYMVNEFYLFMINDLRLTFGVEEEANEKMDYVASRVQEVLVKRESYEHAHVIMKIRKRINECESVD